MFIGLEDFNVDMFLRLEDDNIYIYYIDFETIPELATMLPVGSFEDDRFKFTKLIKTERIQVGLRFLIRDSFAIEDTITGDIQINITQFIQDFDNLPEVMEVINKYTDMCRTIPAPSWCQDCTASECPDHCKADEKCATYIPIEVFDEEDLYFLIVVYFNGIYRTNPEEAQNFSMYDTLTDIDFNLNKYSVITNIQEFFSKEFSYFLMTAPGSTPFANSYGTTIKLAVQTKNNQIRERLVSDEINFFITGFNNIYNDLINIETITIISNETITGADSWQINVFATIKKERLIYRIEF